MKHDSSDELRQFASYQGDGISSFLPPRTVPNYNNPTILHDLTEFWTDVQHYYKRFDPDQIRFVLNQKACQQNLIQTFQPQQFHSNGFIVDTLLSCLIPLNPSMLFSQ